MTIELHNSDCLDALSFMPDNSVDALITDPPAGISFMGKSWDHDKGGRKQWIAWMTGVMSECFRVMKPGAHGLVWAIPRTSHWTGSALEDAGFEVRDVVTHLFGSGFPKSLDISKAIDKAAGAEREVLRTEKRPVLPKGRGNGRDENGRPIEIGMLGASESHIIGVTAPKTDDAKQWEGWGTALKPALEKWILVRKPVANRALDCEVWYTNGFVGGLLCQLSCARFVEWTFTLNEPGLKEVRSDSVQWLAAVLSMEESGVLHEKTDTFSSPEAVSTFLSIARLWSGILAGLSQGANTFTTSTELSLITELKTLNCLLLRTTEGSTTPEKILANGLWLNALDAASILSDVLTRLRDIQMRFAVGSATGLAHSCERSGSARLPVEQGLKADSNEIWLIRKPCSEKTVAANVLKWGCGGINIDGCRIGVSESDPNHRRATGENGNAESIFGVGNSTRPATLTQGRFPANLVLSGDAPEMLDAQSGALKTGAIKKDQYKDGLKNDVYGKFAGFELAADLPAGSGGASRFFYCAKTSTSERNAGLEGMPGKDTYSEDKPTPQRDHREQVLQQNHHPTVKPQKLMRYLCRLITPPSGVVLDPFMGSGSTGLAALSEGFRFIGIEKEQEYFEIAKTRINNR